jgi:hypothetical protein
MSAFNRLIYATCSRESVLASLAPFNGIIGVTPEPVDSATSLPRREFLFCDSRKPITKLEDAVGIQSADHLP